MFRDVGVRPRLVERSVAFDPTQHLLRDGTSVGVVSEGSAEGLADWLRWIPLAEPAPRLLIQLVLPDAGLAPAVARFEQTAVAAAEAAGWLRP